MPRSTRMALPAALLTLILVVPPDPAVAQEAPSAAQEAPSAGGIPHETYFLENGLRVILAPDPQATAVAVNVWYDVGSRHEAPGRSGFGHLFEHLMFEGSERVPRGTFDQLINEAGGSANASITEDRTNYFATVPTSQLARVLWLEADRMEALLVTEESMRREIEVVKEERRMRVDNAPYGQSGLQSRYYAPYDSTSCFAYAHSVIGSMEDLDAAQLEDVQAFFDMYYAPNNATLTLVGLFDPDAVRPLIEQYFSAIAPGPSPPEPRCDDPFRHLPVTLELDDPAARLPGVMLSYGTVEVGHPDSYALNLLGAILGAGQTSRLHRRLVREERAALQAGATSNTRRGPGLFAVQVIANQGVTAERLIQLVDTEIDRIRRDGVTEEELERAKSRARASAVIGRQTVMGRAETLQWANHFLGDPAAYRTEMERTHAVTADQVRAVAQRYLGEGNRAVVITRPATEVTR
jgi:zinc protease